MTNQPREAAGLRNDTDIFGQSWKSRRVVVIGLGRSGLAAARLLCHIGCHVSATDASETTELRTARESLVALGVAEVELGGHSRRLIEQAEVVVVSPGVSESADPIQWALEQHLPVFSEVEVAFRFCRSPVIAVTGTNGKSTAVTLLATLLNVSGRPAIACGNVGIPYSSVINQLSPSTIAVVELSSFQLLWCHQFRPTISVLLNIGTNHLDRHHDPQAYRAAKARLFQRQTQSDWAVLNALDPRVVALGESLPVQRIWFGENRSNLPAYRLAPETRQVLTDSAQAVLQVGRVIGIPDPLTWQVIRAFPGLEHRLEHVATIRGIHFVNDSKSTTPDSLQFALSQLPGALVVIMGGRDKGLNFAPLVDRLHGETRLKGIVLIGEVRSRLRLLLNGSTVVQEAATLEDAVQRAAACAGPGATVLFSPACASFDMFRDFEERGRVFKTVVHHLAERPWGTEAGAGDHTLAAQTYPSSLTPRPSGGIPSHAPA